MRVLECLPYFIYTALGPKGLGNMPGVWRLRRLVHSWLLSHNRYHRAPYLGHTICVCPAHSMGRKIFEGGIYEPAIIKTIQLFCGEGYSFMDIGANIGLHTLAAAFSRTDPGQVFISFEPDPEMFSALTRNCALNQLDFVTCRQEGLGEFAGYLALNISTTNNKGRNSFLALDNTVVGPPTKVTTLDSLFLGDRHMRCRDWLIKIDTEGFELPIIRGGAKWLSSLSNIAIICEISPSMMESNNMAEGELFAAMRACGFDGARIFCDHETALDLGEGNDQYNALFYRGDATARKVGLLATVTSALEEAKPRLGTGH